jgi:hypothetical protein
MSATITLDRVMVTAQDAEEAQDLAGFDTAGKCAGCGRATPAIDEAAATAEAMRREREQVEEAERP